MDIAFRVFVGLPIGAAGVYLASIVMKAAELIFKVGWDSRPLVFFLPHSASIAVGVLLVLAIASLLMWRTEPADFWCRLFSLIAIAELSVLGIGFATNAFDITE
jgi:phosphatidylserine synthase